MGFTFFINSSICASFPLKYVLIASKIFLKKSFMSLDFISTSSLSTMTESPHPMISLIKSPRSSMANPFSFPIKSTFICFIKSSIMGFTFFINSSICASFPLKYVLIASKIFLKKSFMSLGCISTSSLNKIRESPPISFLIASVTNFARLFTTSINNFSASWTTTLTSAESAAIMASLYLLNCSIAFALIVANTFLKVSAIFF